MIGCRVKRHGVRKAWYGPFNKIQKGDKIVYYATGDRIIVGTFEIISDIKYLEKDPYWGEIMVFEIKPDVTLSPEKYLDFRSLLYDKDTKLQLFPDKKRWAYQLWGHSCRTISENDFNFIREKIKSSSLIVSLKEQKTVIKTKKKLKWKLFEKNVDSFLKKCEFDYVNGGLDYQIAERQIDSVAIHQNDGKNYILIIDATSKEDPGFKDIREKIQQFNDIKTDIEKEEIEDPDYKIEVFSKKSNYERSEKISLFKNSKLYFILTLKDIKFDYEAKEDADKYGIVIWGSKYFNLNDKLAKIIGKYAKYTILKELGGVDLSFKDEDEDPFYYYTSFKIDLTGENKGSIYLFPIIPEKLLKLAYVFRREICDVSNFGSNTVFNSYQRMLNERKIKDIGEEFLSVRNGSFKNNIIIVFDKEPEWEPLDVKPMVDCSASIVNIKILKKFASIRILDGQHRLYGFLKAKDDYHKKKKSLIAVGIVPRGDEEAETFLSINTKQTPVDTNILWDLYSITEKNNIEACISNVIKEINKESKENSFENKIYIPSNHRGDVSSRYKMKIGNLCKTLCDLNLLHNPKDLKKEKITLWKGNSEKTIEFSSRVIKKYYNVLKEVLVGENEKWYKYFFMVNNGFNVAMRILSELLQFLGQDNIDNSNNIKSILKDGLLYFISKREGQVDQIVKQTSSEGQRLNIATEIIFSMWLYNNKFAIDYLKRIKRDHFFERLEDLNGVIVMDLRLIVDEVFKNIPNWFDRELVPKDTKDYALRNPKSGLLINLKENRLFSITEGQLVEIIEKNYSKFFNKYFEKRFENIDEFKKMAQTFKNKRSDKGHWIPKNLNPNEIAVLYDFFEKIRYIREFIVPTKSKVELE